MKQIPQFLLIQCVHALAARVLVLTKISEKNGSQFDNFSLNFGDDGIGEI
jgi:hypothetical protein